MYLSSHKIILNRTFFQHTLSFGKITSSYLRSRCDSNACLAGTDNRSRSHQSAAAPDILTLTTLLCDGSLTYQHRSHSTAHTFAKSAIAYVLHPNLTTLILADSTLGIIWSLPVNRTYTLRRLLRATRNTGSDTRNARVDTAPPGFNWSKTRHYHHGAHEEMERHLSGQKSKGGRHIYKAEAA